jgi:hypothetical protein
VRIKRIGLVTLAVVALVLLWWKARDSFGPSTMVAKAQVAAPGGALNINAGPHIGNCPILPVDNVWNTPIDKLKLDKHSADYVQHMMPETPLHPNFGSDPRNGIPITLTKAGRAWVPIKMLYAEESDSGQYPTPEGALMEGTWDAPPGEDRHILMVDQDRCLLSELGSVLKQPDGSWSAGAGIKIDLTSNALRAPNKTSTDAAGLPVLPGLLRYDDILVGEVKHAIRFTTRRTQRAYVWPARHFASKLTDAGYPPMGQRFRLKADFDISKFSKTNQIILTGLKKYGMILSDNGAPWFIIGETDKRWDDEDLGRLKTIKGDNFEAVDEADWQMLGDSGRVDPVAFH